MSGLVEMLNHVAPPLLAALWRASWQGGLALALVGGLVRLRPRMAPPVQCWLWRLAYLKLLIALVWGTPLTLAILPPSQTSPTPPWAKTSTAASTVESAVIMGHETPGALEAAVVPTQSPPLALTPWVGLLSLWLAVVVWQAGRALLQWRDTDRIYRACSPLENQEWLSVCTQLSNHLGLRRTPRLLVWKGAATPLLLGTLNAAIVLPEEILTSCAPQDQRLILAHELAHVRRRDLLWAWLPLLARTLFCFHPLVWFALRELTTAQEMACDSIALELSPVPIAAYGNLLIRIAAQGSPDAGSGLTMVGIAASYHTLKRRLSAMTTIKPLSPARLALSGTALLISGILGIVPWHVAAQTPLAPSLSSPEIAVSTTSLPLVKPSVAPEVPSGKAQGQAAGASDTKPLEANVGKYKVLLEKVVVENREVADIFANGFHFRPNTTVFLKITAPQASDLRMLTGLSPQVTAIDANGVTVEKSPATMPSRFLPAMGPGSGLLFLRLQDPAVKSLRSLEGELVISEGKPSTVEFADNDLKAGTERRFGDITLKLEAFRTDGVDIQADLSLTIPPPQFDALTLAKNPQLPMEVQQQNVQSLTAELRNAKAHVYHSTSLTVLVPLPHTIKPVDNTAAVPQPAAGPVVPAKPGGSPLPVHVAFHLPAADASPKTLVLSVTAHNGKTERIPFKFTDVPLSRGK